MKSAISACTIISAPPAVLSSEDFTRISPVTSLSSPAYRAPLGENGDFLLMHSVGSLPHNSEVDVPLNYADYYFLEALKRKKDLGK